MFDNKWLYIVSEFEKIIQNSPPSFFKIEELILFNDRMKNFVKKYSHILNTNHDIYYQLYDILEQTNNDDKIIYLFDENRDAFLNKEFAKRTFSICPDLLDIKFKNKKIISSFDNVFSYEDLKDIYNQYIDNMQRKIPVNKKIYIKITGNNILGLMWKYKIDDDFMINIIKNKGDVLLSHIIPNAPFGMTAEIRKSKKLKKEFIKKIASQEHNFYLKFLRNINLTIDDLESSINLIQRNIHRYYPLIPLKEQKKFFELTVLKNNPESILTNINIKKIQFKPNIIEPYIDILKKIYDTPEKIRQFILDYKLTKIEYLPIIKELNDTLYHRLNAMISTNKLLKVNGFVRNTIKKNTDVKIDDISFDL